MDGLGVEFEGSDWALLPVNNRDPDDNFTVTVDRSN